MNGSTDDFRCLGFDGGLSRAWRFGCSCLGAWASMLCL